MARPVIGFAVLLVMSVGCNRQDADTLARIGDNLATRAKAVAPVGKVDKLTAAMPGPSGEKDTRPASEKRKSAGRQKG
jgi:hypothetical protein